MAKAGVNVIPYSRIFSLSSLNRYVLECYSYAVWNERQEPIKLQSIPSFRMTDLEQLAVTMPKLLASRQSARTSYK